MAGSQDGNANMTDFPFTADVVLLNSGETARKGMYVELGLHHEIDGPICPEDRNPFMDLDQGREKGQRFRVTFHLLAEDEQTTEPEQTEERPKGGERAKRKWDELTPTQQAGIACKDPAFQQWVCLKNGNEPREDTAASMVRGICGVDSRSELSLYPAAATAWGRLYVEFKQAQHGDADAARLAQRDRT